MSHYDNGVLPLCSRLSGFRLNSWTFPQGVVVKPLYAATTDYDSHTENVPDGPYPSSSLPIGVSNYFAGSSMAARSTISFIRWREAHNRAVNAPDLALANPGLPRKAAIILKSPDCLEKKW
ncbi:MAG TPA: hypothetical protein VGG48_05275 [Rhizomicrobium sp.]